jgi:hypothetical protein
MADYSIKRYINNELKETKSGFSLKEAYELAIPKEAMRFAVYNKWHVLRYDVAFSRLKDIPYNEEIVVAYEEAQNQNNMEHTRITITREELKR